MSQQIRHAGPGGSGTGTAPAKIRPGGVRLRTLVFIRWIAVLGQATTVVLVHFGLGFSLPLVPCAVVIAASVLLNVIVSLTIPLGRYLPDRLAAVFLGYDMLQLTALLYLTGGLQNPFSVLILASVAVSATILRRSNTIGLGALAVACLSVLAFLYEPFPWRDQGFALPDFYMLAIWQALVITVVFLAAYIGSVSEEAQQMSDALGATQMALDREQRLSELGALAAAAAHELGSPLNTIQLAANEMARDVPADSPLREDIDLLVEQTARCRDILAQLSRRPDVHTEEGLPFARLPLSSLLELAAAPHRLEPTTLEIDAQPMESAPDSSEPLATRSPEFIHGVGTLIQNALQFARSRVVILARWSDELVSVSIIDDGPGFPPGLLDRLGEPYVSTRSTRDGHMGLGIFIAETLLNRAGAELVYTNRQGSGRGRDRSVGGAVVTIEWPRSAFEAEGT